MGRKGERLSDLQCKDGAAKSLGRLRRREEILITAVKSGVSSDRLLLLVEKVRHAHCHLLKAQAAVIQPSSTTQASDQVEARVAKLNKAIADWHGMNADEVLKLFR